MTLQLGFPVPDFELPDLDGSLHRLSDQRGRIVIVNFWSCECPHSERADNAILEKLTKWGSAVVLLSIASNRNEKLEDVKKVSEARRLPAVLIDADCQVADMFEAQTTPHIFVIDRDGILRYRGAADDVTFRKRIPTRFFLDEAVEALFEGHPPALTESPAYGCAIVREV